VAISANVVIIADLETDPLIGGKFIVYGRCDVGTWIRVCSSRWLSNISPQGQRTVELGF
jgi:hypothetical protein